MLSKHVAFYNLILNGGTGMTPFAILPLIAPLALLSTPTVQPDLDGGAARVIQSQDIPCGTGVFGQGGVRNDPRCRTRPSTRVAPPPPAPPPTPDVADPLDIAANAQKAYIVSVPPSKTLSLRARPHHQSREILSLRNGDSVRGGNPRTQPNGSRWTGVCHDKTCGWATSRYLKPGTPPPTRCPPGQRLHYQGFCVNN